MLGLRRYPLAFARVVSSIPAFDFIHLLVVSKRVVALPESQPRLVRKGATLMAKSNKRLSRRAQRGL